MRNFTGFLKISCLPAFAAGAIFLSLSCGKNLPNTPAGPVTVVEIGPTATPTLNPGAGDAWFSVNASAGFGARYNHSTLVFDNVMWVIGGFIGSGAANDVWYSPGGIAWTQALANTASPGASQFGQRQGHASQVFNEKMWVIGGFSNVSGGAPLNDVWYSLNGIAWTQVLADNASPGTAQFAQRSTHSSAVFNDRLWIIGGHGNLGFFNDVWNTLDGTTWAQVLPSTATPGTSQFSQRMGHSTVVYNNLLWVIGGVNTTPAFQNDVWSSPDGVNWTQVLADNAAPGSTQFSPRGGHTSVVYENLLWVIGGANTGGMLNDAWYSADGKTWTQATPAAAFTARASHSSVVFNNEMWVIGGENKSANPLDDVWESP